MPQSSQNPSRRDDLMVMLLHGGAATNAIAKHVVDAFAAEVRAENTHPLPDGFERDTCVTVGCAACGYRFDEDEFVQHFSSVAEAVSEVIGAGWIGLKDGRVLCTAGDEKHDELRITVGVISNKEDAS